VYRDLAQHYRAIKFLHIDIDHAAETEGLSELVDKIRSVPTFHFYRDGKIIDFLYGGNISQLKIKVDALNTLGAMAAAAAAASEKKSAMIANAAAITAATNAVIAASAPLQPKIIEQKQQQLPPPQLAPPQEDNKQKLAIPAVIPSDDSKLAASAPGSVASSAAVTPAITNTTTTTNATTETNTSTINNEQTNNLNPIIDIYNSIDFINVTSNGLALVDYSAVWCPPCVRVQPILKDIAQNYKNIKFVHIDIDHAADTDLAELVDKISSVPTFHFYSEGRVIDALQGANIAQLRSKVETLSNLNTNAANNLIQPFSNAKIGSDNNNNNNNNNNNLTTNTNNEKKEKKKSKSSDEKKAADKKKKRKSKRKEKEAAAAKSQANNTSVGPVTTNNNNKSQGDATSAATLVSITTNTAKDIVE
jgi:thioredoxin 1